MSVCVNVHDAYKDRAVYCLHIHKCMYLITFAPHMTRKQIILLLILALVQFTNIVDFMIIMPLGPKLKELWHIDSTQFSRLVSAFSIGAFISAISCLAFVDRFDRKKVLMLVYCGFTVGTFLCGLSNNYQQLLGARFLTGLFGGIGGSVILSMVGDAIPADRRGQAMGILMTGFSVASIVGVPGGLWLAAHFQWHTPFLMLAGLCTFVFLAAFLVLPNFTEHLQKGIVKENALVILRRIFSDANKRWALLLGGLAVMSHFSIIPFLTDYCVNNLKFDFKTTVPFIYVVGGLLSVVNSPLIGKFSDKYGRFKVFAILTVLSLIPLAGIPNLHTDSKLVLLTIFSTLFIFSGSRMIISQAQITTVVKPQERGAFMIINSSVQQLSTGIIAAVGGAIVSNDSQMRVLHYPTLGIVGIVLAVLAALVFRKLKTAAV
jgi:MFS transporter, DHA1 family, inner membrane transport protein